MEWYKSAEHFTDALSTADPTPGGGAAGAMAGAMGCALLLMAVQTTLKRKATPQEAKTTLAPCVNKLMSLKKQLDGYIQQDGEAYAGYLAAAKLPKEAAEREEAVQNALLFAARVPADAACAAQAALRAADEAEPFVAPVILSDITCGRHLLKACIRCGAENIRANAVYIKDEELRQKLETQISNLLKSC